LNFVKKYTGNYGRKPVRTIGGGIARNTVGRAGRGIGKAYRSGTGRLSYRLDKWEKGQADGRFKGLKKGLAKTTRNKYVKGVATVATLGGTEALKKGH